MQEEERRLKMKGYKAFGKGLVCRGKQYAEILFLKKIVQLFAKKVCTFVKTL